MKKDMSDPIIQQEYDIKIYDGARDLAATYKQDAQGMRTALKTLGISDCAQLGAVMRSQKDPEYEEINYRGKLVDEGVIEALKDCLRPLHGF